jgi:hypothetical protein
MSTIPILSLLILAACILLAAWPLLWLPAARRAISGAAGSACIAGGSTLFGLLVSGVISVPALTMQAVAQEPSLVDDSADLSKEDSAANDKKTEEAKAAEKPQTNITPDATTSEPDLGVIAEEGVIIPPGRPEWISTEPDFSSAVHMVAVSSGPYVRENDCRKALDRALVTATNDYIASQIDNHLATRFIRYDAKTIKRRFVKSDNLYHDVAVYRQPVGPMHEYFALLEFDAEFRNELDRHWANVMATSRLEQTGLFAGAALLLVSSIFGYFRLDNATRGYYTRRLQVMTAAAILSVVGAGAVVAQWITWL